MKKVAGSLKLLYSQYRELQSFAQFGSDLDADTKARLAQGERVVEVLKQDRNAPVPVAKQVAIIYAVTNNYLKDVPVARVKEYEQELYTYMDNAAPAVLEEIDTTGALSAEGFARLDEALTAFTARFLGQ
jgi:F-type H+-transporting ATPase subunit alpha